MKEWKYIEGFGNLYKISNCGDVISCYSRWGKRKIPKILKPVKEKKGYLAVVLRDQDGNKKRFKVHRLVAQTFIPNPCNYPQVNHKDENKENNCISNLEWCTNEYNHNYGTRNKRTAEKKRKEIIQMDKNGNAIKKWRSITEASKMTGIPNGNISNVLNNKPHNKTAGGYKWVFNRSNSYI